MNLRRLLDEALGTPADFATLRAALRRDPRLLADILARMAGRLPHALVLVFDQAEEVFTLARTPEEVAGRDHALRMLQRVVDVQADVKLIISLRTEYYGRLLDHLRAGRRDLTGVRDDLLRDFSRPALIEAITRPTSETPLAPGQPSPREKYGFRYAEGIPEPIADGVLALRSENQDSVLPLVQVICTQLYEREKSRPGSDGVITREDLDAIKGVEGGLQGVRRGCPGAVAAPRPRGSRGVQGAVQPALQPPARRHADDLADAAREPWRAMERLDAVRSGPGGRQVGPPAARGRAAHRGGRAAPYVRLGHDALAKVAAAWKAEREEQEHLQRERDQVERERKKRQQQVRRLVAGVCVAAGVAILFGITGVWALHQKTRRRR